jgi:hypothetical protein
MRPITNFHWFQQFGLYADTERGKYPVWQSLDHEGFFPGSGIIFATVVVRPSIVCVLLIRAASAGRLL